jgi:hypothetical protein
LGSNTNFVDEVRKQFLADAGPDANSKYDQMVGDLFNGKLDMNALRAQAKAAADQIKTLKGQGEDASGLLDSYLAVLNTFLNETASQSSPTSVK